VTAPTPDPPSQPPAQPSVSSSIQAATPAAPSQSSFTTTVPTPAPIADPQTWVQLQVARITSRGMILSAAIALVGVLVTALSTYLIHSSSSSEASSSSSISPSHVSASAAAAPIPSLSQARSGKTAIEFTVTADKWPPEAVPGLTVKRGQQLHLTYQTGAARCTSDGAKKPQGPGGDPAYRANTLPYMLVSDEPICSLVGKSGLGAWHEIGKSTLFTADSDGQLFLTVNELKPGGPCTQGTDDQSCYKDNVGSFDFAIQ
jgi:hypothetical protein